MILKVKTCPWSGCTKAYSDHTIAELDNHKKISGGSAGQWSFWNKFGTVVSIFSSCLLVFWILLGGLRP